jgi:hypothetical protein
MNALLVPEGNYPYVIICFKKFDKIALDPSLAPALYLPHV